MYHYTPLKTTVRFQVAKLRQLVSFIFLRCDSTRGIFVLAMRQFLATLPPTIMALEKFAPLETSNSSSENEFSTSMICRKRESRWWFQIFFYFHPYLGKIPILTNIFQMGWNHQLENSLLKKHKIMSLFEFGGVSWEMFFSKENQARLLHCRQAWNFVWLSVKMVNCMGSTLWSKEV